MQIITAEHAGFCFGVKRAVSEVYALTEKAQPHAESAILSGGNAGCKTKIYTIGKLIHNPQITGELEKKGVSVISPEEISEISDKTNSENKSIIVIRAHGIRKEISERLSFLSESNLSLSVCDMTCPYVKKIHRLVQQMRTASCLFSETQSIQKRMGYAATAAATPWSSAIQKSCVIYQKALRS